MSNESNFIYPNYTAEEHGTWKLLLEKQKSLLPERACQEYLDGLDILNFPTDQIPALKNISRTLYSCTGWRLIRVEGLVPEREFFQFLSQKLFPSTDFIRKREDLAYTPAPDMFHDLFGHTSMITNQDFADFFQTIGRLGAAAPETELKEIQKLYWFTVEFGLIRQKSQKKIYGSGILSSPNEVLYCLGDKVHVHEFNMSEIINQEYDIWHMQDKLFIIDSFKQLKEEFENYRKFKKL